MNPSDNIIERVYDYIEDSIDKKRLIYEKEFYIKELLEDIDDDIHDAIDDEVRDNSRDRSEAIIKDIYSYTIFDTIKMYKRNDYGSYDDLLETENEDLFYAKLAYACIREDIYDNMDEFKNDLANYIKRQKLDELDEEEQEHNAIVLNNSNNF
jgi:hypothetical protein